MKRFTPWRLARVSLLLVAILAAVMFLACMVMISRGTGIRT